MKDLIHITERLLPQESFDALAVGVIDFSSMSFKSFETMNTIDGPVTTELGSIYYDLASLTKPLTNSLSYFLKPEAFDEKMLLCLSHRGGLPAWGLLPHKGWEKIISSYEIKESGTLYSDYSALRVMLELRAKGIDQKEICQKIWDKELLNWLDLSPDMPTLQNGYVSGEANFTEVHDPNARNLRVFCSHAGLFSTVGGLCRTLLNYEAKTGMLQKIAKKLKEDSHRFVYGWDRVENPVTSLCGKGAGEFTFGHLGFTGQSIWIDPDRLLGHVILSNATKHYWYEKQGLNDIRRALGEAIWRMKRV